MRLAATASEHLTWLSILYISEEDIQQVLDGVRVWALSRPVQNLYARALQEITLTLFYGKRHCIATSKTSVPYHKVQLLRESCYFGGLCCIGLGAWCMVHGPFTPIKLADSATRHAPPDHLGAPSVFNCVGNALWTEPVSYSPYKSPLCPTEKLKGAFIPSPTVRQSSLCAGQQSGAACRWSQPSVKVS